MADWNELRKWDTHGSDEPNWLVRLCSYLALVVGGSLATGAIVFCLNIYVLSGASRRRSRRNRTGDPIMEATKDDITNWFWIGAAIGLVLTIGFIIMYHVRHGRTHLDDHLE